MVIIMTIGLRIITMRKTIKMKTINTLQSIAFLIFVSVATLILFFPLIIALITKNYWLFFLFFVSWIPASIIGKIGVYLCSD